MTICLINMPFYEQEYTKFSEKWDYIEDEYIGINIIHSILEKSGVEVIRATANSIAGLLTLIHEEAVDCVMVSVMQTSARLTYEFLLQLQKSGYDGATFIGGWFAKLSWQYIFDNHWPVDYVCYVDAENVLEQWLATPNKEIVGIATYDNYKAQSQLPIKDVRAINQWPQNYISPVREPGRKTYRLETSRGCPHACCTFCSLSCANVIKDKWKPLPLEIVLDEITRIYTNYGVTRFSLTDDDMLGPIEYVENRAHEIRDAFCGLPFKVTFSGSISVRAATNGQILDYLLESGLEQLGIGFESADEKQLRRYNKQQTLEENFIAAENIVQRSINLIPGLITFDPFATKDTIEKNLDFLFNHLHHYDLGKLTKKLYVITGTPIAKLVQRDGLLIGDYLNFDYTFMYEETARLYHDFQEYTKMAKDVQLSVNSAGRAFDRTIGIHHQNVAKMIIAEKEWRSYAVQEIATIRSMLG